MLVASINVLAVNLFVTFFTYNNKFQITGTKNTDYMQSKHEIVDVLFDRASLKMKLFLIPYDKQLIFFHFLISLVP